MFGYITVNRPELKIKDYDTYHSFYCGLCHILYERFGLRGQVTLTYDMTFLVMLLLVVVAVSVGLERSLQGGREKEQKEKKQG